jgi:hypothetical protein
MMEMSSIGTKWTAEHMKYIRRRMDGTGIGQDIVR